MEGYNEDYMAFLASHYSVPPSSVYEYETQSYEHKPAPKSYQFMGDPYGDVEYPPDPSHIEYVPIVQSLAPDISRIRTDNSAVAQTR